MDIHHESKVPNTRWAAENTQPCVHTCSLYQEGYSHSYTMNRKTVPFSNNKDTVESKGGLEWKLSSIFTHTNGTSCSPTGAPALPAGCYELIANGWQRHKARSMSRRLDWVKYILLGDFPFRGTTLGFRVYFSGITWMFP